MANEEPRLRCVVVVPEGPSRRVGPSGVLIGRQRDCDIVASDPSISRRHALVRLTAEGAEVVPLGRAPITLNGVEHATPAPLAHGDELALPGLTLRIEVELPRADRGAISGFALERADGGTFGIAHTPFTLGGGDTDDLIIKKWPASALHFHLAQGELFVEVRAGKLTCNGSVLATGTLEPLSVGDQLSYRDETFTIAHAVGRVATTAVGSRSELPSHVVIEMLPRGGRVVFTIGARDHAVYLADRRFDLVVALLRPPTGFQPGDFIPDDVVRSIVWPRKHSVSRPEINMLISRCRRDLLDAGLAGPRLLERAPGGGGTRLVLAANASVDVRS
ncbi:MAG TPA: FHA domain-containing protein [Kofleriaceae bacterium]|nr:FHA domain-containing protein [Kofleriaceae bacterium]